MELDTAALGLEAIARRLRPRLLHSCREGLIDEYEVYLDPLVWGEGNVHVLGDRGTIRLELADVKRFESGVVLLTYRPAS